jgi:magnesium-transporting ATPase (P-type)
VPGDGVKLAANGMVAADVRLVSAKDLFSTPSALIGESLPADKPAPAGTRADISRFELPPVPMKEVGGLLRFMNVCFLGTGVESGTTKVLRIVPGVHTDSRNVGCIPRKTFTGRLNRQREAGSMQTIPDDIHRNSMREIDSFPNERGLNYGQTLYALFG